MTPQAAKLLAHQATGNLSVLLFCEASLPASLALLARMDGLSAGRLDSQDYGTLPTKRMTAGIRSLPYQLTQVHLTFLFLGLLINAKDRWTK